jgi:hypothetical protein
MEAWAGLYQIAKLSSQDQRRIILFQLGEGVSGAAERALRLPQHIRTEHEVHSRRPASTCTVAYFCTYQHFLILLHPVTIFFHRVEVRSIIIYMK